MTPRTRGAPRDSEDAPLLASPSLRDDAAVVAQDEALNRQSEGISALPLNTGVSSNRFPRVSDPGGPGGGREAQRTASAPRAALTQTPGPVRRLQEDENASPAMPPPWAQKYSVGDTPPLAKLLEAPPPVPAWLASDALEKIPALSDIPPWPLVQGSAPNRYRSKNFTRAQSLPPEGTWCVEGSLDLAAVPACEAFGLSYAEQEEEIARFLGELAAPPATSNSNARHWPPEDSRNAPAPFSQSDRERHQNHISHHPFLDSALWRVSDDVSRSRERDDHVYRCILADQDGDHAAAGVSGGQGSNHDYRVAQVAADASNSLHPIGTAALQANPEEQDSSEVARLPCRICGRRFRESRLQFHEEICSRHAAKVAPRRPVFDSHRQRRTGVQTGRWWTETDGASGSGHGTSAANVSVEPGHAASRKSNTTSSQRKGTAKTLPTTPERAPARKSSIIGITPEKTEKRAESTPCQRSQRKSHLPSKTSPTKSAAPSATQKLTSAMPKGLASSPARSLADPIVTKKGPSSNRTANLFEGRASPGSSQSHARAPSRPGRHSKAQQKVAEDSTSSRVDGPVAQQVVPPLPLGNGEPLAQYRRSTVDLEDSSRETRVAAYSSSASVLDSAPHASCLMNAEDASLEMIPYIEDNSNLEQLSVDVTRCSTNHRLEGSTTQVSESLESCSFAGVCGDSVLEPMLKEVAELGAQVDELIAIRQKLLAENRSFGSTEHCQTSGSFWSPSRKSYDPSRYCDDEACFEIASRGPIADLRDEFEVAGELAVARVAAADCADVESLAFQDHIRGCAQRIRERRSDIERQIS